MFKPNLDQLEDVVNMILYECPKEMYGELYECQPDCCDVKSCFDCWYETIRGYQVEQSLKSMNDEGEVKDV